MRPPARPAHEDLARLASITGTAPGAPAASASSVETPAAGTSSASASPRAAARPIRMPVKLPGPDADGERVDVARVRARLAQELVDVGEHARRAGGPLAEHLPVADERARSDVVAVSKARISTAKVSVALEHDRRARARRRARSRTRQRAAGGSAGSGRLRPLDEDDGVVEVRLEVAPLRLRDAREAIEVEVGDGDAPS